MAFFVGVYIGFLPDFVTTLSGFFVNLVAIMAFLTTNDLTMSPTAQAQLIGIDSDIFNDSFATAEAYLNDRLVHMYDMDAELTKTGTSRRLTLVKIGVKIAEWEAYKQAPQVNIPAQAEYNYNEAMAQLDQVEEGKLLTNLDPQEEESKQIGLVRYGSNDDESIIF